MFSSIEFLLIRELAELNFINISILLILFSIVYFVYWNNKSYSYIMSQKPVSYIVCDVLTSIVFFVFVSIATPNPLISTVNKNAIFYFKNNLGEWVLFAYSIIVSLIVYFIVQRIFMKKSWEYVLGNLASFFLLVSLLLFIFSFCLFDYASLIK